MLYRPAYSQQPVDTRLGEENKGHQLLRKMGKQTVFMIYILLTKN